MSVAASERATGRRKLVVLVPLALFLGLAALFYFRLYAIDSDKLPSALIGRPVPLSASPNGTPGPASPAAHVAMARETGFEAAVSTAEGAASTGGDLYQIPRFTPWDKTRWRYGLRLARNARQGQHASL